MSNDDVFFQHRLALFAHAKEVGVKEACLVFGVHLSTYYLDLLPLAAVLQRGLDALRPWE